VAPVRPQRHRHAGAQCLRQRPVRKARCNTPRRVIGSFPHGLLIVYLRTRVINVVDGMTCLSIITGVLP